MAHRWDFSRLGARWLAVLAAAGLLALFSAPLSRASEDSPYSSITAWQMEKLRGTEFSTHPIRKIDARYYLSRRLKQGELFESFVQKYCEVAGIGAEKCKEVEAAAVEHHSQEHWHRNWQVNDEVVLRVPDEVYRPKQP